MNILRMRGGLAAAIAMLLLLLPALAGCKGGVTPIGKILDKPESYRGKDVTVAGKVTRVLDPSSGLLNIAAYQIEDGSGKIWIVTKRGAPSVGSEVGLKGSLKADAGNLGSEIVGAVLEEEDRRSR